jgi:transcriptional regulator with XRE-family HTH domain
MSIKSKMTQKTLKEIEKITGTRLTFGKLLWAIREADDISQVDFSETLKISRQHLCDIEHGRKSVSLKLAVRYAGILGYPKEQFIRLALQDLVDREGLNVQVEINLVRGRKKQNDSRIAA